MIRRVRGGRRAGGGPAEAIAQIKKRWPEAWANLDIRGAFMMRALPLYGMGATSAPVHRDAAEIVAAWTDIWLPRLLAARSSRQDVMLPWLFREVFGWIKSRRRQQHGPQDVDQAVELAATHRRAGRAVGLRHESLTTIRDWAVQARPNLWDYDAGQALAAAKAWHDKLEVTKSQRAMKKARAAFTQEILKGPWGTWRGIPRSVVGDKPSLLMIPGKALGLCTQHEYHAREYGQYAWTVILWDAKGWPRASVTFEAERRPGYGYVAGNTVSEAKGFGNKTITHPDPLAPAVVALLRKIVGAPSADWGEGLHALDPKTVKGPERAALAAAAAEELGDPWQYLDQPRSRTSDDTLDWHIGDGHFHLSAYFEDWFEADLMARDAAFSDLEDEHGHTLEELAALSDDYELELQDLAWNFFDQREYPTDVRVSEEDKLTISTTVDLSETLYYPARVFYEEAFEPALARVRAALDWYLGGNGYAVELHMALDRALAYRRLQLDGDVAGAERFKQQYAQHRGQAARRGRPVRRRRRRRAHRWG